MLLHITEYRALIIGEGQFLQGRYLLPVVGLLGLAIALIVSRIPLKARALVCALTLVALALRASHIPGHRRSRLLPVRCDR